MQQQNENSVMRYYDLNENTYRIIAGLTNSQTNFSDIINNLILTFLNLPDSLTNILAESLYKIYWDRHKNREKKRKRLIDGDVARTDEFLNLDELCIHYAGLILFYGKEPGNTNSRWPVHEIDFSRARYYLTGESHDRLFQTKVKTTRCHISLSYQAAEVMDSFLEKTNAKYPSEVLNALIALIYTMPKDCQATLLSFMRSYSFLADPSANETCYLVWRFLKDTFQTESKSGKEFPFPRTNDINPEKKRRKRTTVNKTITAET